MPIATFDRWQIKALQAYIAERDVAIGNIADLFREVGLDPEGPPYQINWRTGDVELPVMQNDEPTMKLVPIKE